MSEELIQSYIDRPAFKADTDFAISELQRVLNAYENLKNSKANVVGAGALKDIVAGSKEAEAAITNLKKANDGYTESVKKQSVVVKDNEKVKAAATKTAQQEAKIASDLSNDYKQLSQAYNDAALKAKNYALQLGSNHPLAVQAAADARLLNDKLKEVDASVGQTNRNVGNYAGSLGGFFNKLLGPLRTAANILPGLGLSGIFLLAFDAISNVSQALGLFNSKLFTTKEQYKLLAEVNGKAAENAGKEAGQLKILRSEIENTNVPMATRLQAVKDIQKQYPDYFKGLTTEQILTGNVGKAYDNAADAILRKARANAAAAEIERLSSENIKTNLALQLKGEEARVKIAKAQDDAQIVSGGSAGGGGNFGGVSRAAKQQAIAENYAIEGKAATDLIKLNNKKIDFLLQYTDKGAKETIDIETGKNEAIKQSTKEIFDAEFEETKRQLQRKISLASDQLGNEKLTFDQRIALLQEFSTQSINLINLEAGREKEVLLKKQADLNANLKVAKGTERNNILAELKDTAQRIIDVDNKAAVERVKVLDNNQKQYDKIQEDAAKKAIQLNKETHDFIMQAFEDQQEEKKALLDKQYLADTTALVDNLRAGLITEKQYADARMRLDLGYHADKLELEIEYAKKLIEIRKISGQDVSKEEQKLFDLEMKLNDLKLKKIKDNNKNIADDYLKTFMVIKDVGEKVFSLIEGLVNAQLIATKNALQAQSDAAEKKAARDIEIVNASTATEEQKAARIAIINARLQAQKDQIAQREREAQEKKARVDKALAIFQITINTAIAVTKALASYDYVGAILAGALGAAQLAVAIATPIPKYKHGKSASDNYEGLAVVDDGGRAEAIQRADGSIEIGSNKPRVAYVGKNDIVHPNADAFMKSAFGVAHNGSIVPHQPVQKQDDSVAREMKKHSALLREIANKPVQRIAATDKGMESVWHWGANEARYAEENCNWKR